MQWTYRGEALPRPTVRRMVTCEIKTGIFGEIDRFSSVTLFMTFRLKEVTSRAVRSTSYRLELRTYESIGELKSGKCPGRRR